ncbi:MAG TPA: biotin/lipoyl-containing protein [Candidatus Limnocylindrales bacterium]|nr:biotin/lipoyl-containing protein [Candidatus Limnocylindrales bacterium]
MEMQFRAGSRNLCLTVTEKDGRTTVAIDGREVAIDDVAIDERSVTLTIGGKRRRVLFDSERGHVFTAYAGHAWEFVPAEEGSADQGGAGAFEPNVTSPMPGKVLQILAAAGDVVEPDGALLLLEAMKMEMTVRATHRCRVVAIKVEAGSMVGPGDTLVVLEEAPEEA